MRPPERAVPFLAEAQAGACCRHGVCAGALCSQGKAHLRKRGRRQRLRLSWFTRSVDALDHCR